MCPLSVLSVVDRGQHGHPDLSAAPYTTNNDAQCILTPFYPNQHHHFWQFELQLFVCWIGPYGPAFALYMYQWATATHDPVVGSTLLPLLDHFWLIDTDHCRAVLQMIWPRTSVKLAMTIWSSSNLLISFRLAIFPVSKISTEMSLSWGKCSSLSSLLQCQITCQMTGS